MSYEIPLEQVSLKELKVTTVKKRTVTSKSGINKVLKRVRDNLESSWTNGSVQSILFYIKNNEKDSQVKIMGFGPDGSKFVDSEEFFPIKKKITNEMKSWKSAECGAKKKTRSDVEEINEEAGTVIKPAGNALKRKNPPVNWKNLDQEARLETVRELYGKQKKAKTLTSTITDTNSPLNEENQILIAVEEVQFSEMEVELFEETDDDYNTCLSWLRNNLGDAETVSGKAEETFRPLEEEQSIEIEKRKPKEGVIREKEKRKKGLALAKEEEKRKIEEKRKKAEAMEKDEETRKTDEILAKEEEKRKKDEENRKKAKAMTIDEETRKLEEEKRKEDDARAKEEENRKIDEENRKKAEAMVIDEEKRKIEEALAKEEEKRKEADAMAKEEEKRQEADARAKEEEKQKEADARAKEEEKRKEADARAKEEEKQKEADARAKEEEKRKEADALAKEEEKRKEADAMAKEEEKRIIDKEKRKIDKEKRKIDKEKRKIDEEKRKIDVKNRKKDEEKRKIEEVLANEEEKQNRGLGEVNENGIKSFPNKANKKGRGRPRKKCSSLKCDSPDSGWVLCGVKVGVKSRNACGNWFHYKCEEVRSDEIDALPSHQAYKCKKCIQKKF